MAVTEIVIGARIAYGGSWTSPRFAGWQGYVVVAGVERNVPGLWPTEQAALREADRERRRLQEAK